MAGPLDPLRMKATTGGFRNRLHHAWQQHQQGQPLPWGRVILSGFILLAVLLAVIALGEPGNRAAAFAREGGAITWVSFAMLLSAAIIAWRGALMPFPGEVLRRLIWLCMAGGLSFLAADEVLGFHESVGLWLDGQVSVREAGFRTWNDLIVIGYGVVALPLLLAFAPELLRHRGMLQMLGLGFLAYAGHTAVDSLFKPSGISVVIEEGFKVSCGLALVWSMALGVRGLLWELSSSSAIDQ